MVGHSWSPGMWFLERAERPVVWLGRHVGYRNFIITMIWFCCALSFWFSFELRYDFRVPQTAHTSQLVLTPLIGLFKTLLFIMLQGHAASWRYVGLRDMQRLLVLNVIATLVMWSVCYLDGFSMVRRGVILIDFFMSCILVGGLFLSLRIYRERFLKAGRGDPSVPVKKVVIFGAGDGGEMIVREILRNPAARMSVTAFFDDNPRKQGTTLHGIRVLGGLEAVADYLRKHGADMVIVAIPSATRDQMRRIHTALQSLDVMVKTVPALAELINGNPTLSQLREINIADLLGRKEIRIDSERINEMLRGKVVLVTGAGGSIGSELCRQALQRKPAELLLMERSENNLFHLHRRLTELNGSTRIIPILCDITNEKRIAEEFKLHRPNIVLHAAAHKHVPLQELNPAECFRNNVGGTRSVARASSAHGVELFVMISTDKAVNPTSVMGATKRACEILCQSFSHVGETKFVSVRFGNVLGSEGSVVPIFLEQIARGGPVTITHPDMKRYFMTIPEAVTLVLQAAAIGQTGQVLVLDMGPPIKIVDLAHHLLQLVGKSPAEVPIEFVGLRPGEKLFEELSCSAEECVRTSHESIWIFDENGSRGRKDVDVIERALREIQDISDLSAAQGFLMQIVPEYAPRGCCPTGTPEGIEALAAKN